MKCTSAGLFAAAMLFSGAIAADHSPTISLEGFGPLKFGMPSEQVERIIQYDKPYRLGASDECGPFTMPQFEPLSLSFTLERKTFVRLDVEFGTTKHETSAQTDQGIGLGSAEEDVLKAYPGAVIKRNPSDPTWHTIVVQTPDHSRGIMFETNGKTVKSIRAGFTPDISTAEACN